MNDILNHLYWFAGLLTAMLLSPLVPGIINKTKAFFAGRKGPSIFQLYYDMAKLLNRANIRSTTSGGLVRLAPMLNLAALLGAMMLLPHAMQASPVAFVADMILFLYFLGAGRVITVLGAMDTGSSFEGMGASREIQFSVLAELGFAAVLAFLAVLTHCPGGLSSILLYAGDGGYAGGWNWQADWIGICFCAFALLILLLAENCRVPFDDPETHLELTMIHEAMILDNGGPDLAVIHYGAALKLWILSVFFVSILIPAMPMDWMGLLIQPLAVLLTGVLIGVIESTMARYRFLKVPQMLLTAFGLAAIAIALLLMFGKEAI